MRNRYTPTEFTRPRRALAALAVAIASLDPAVTSGQAKVGDPKDTTHAQMQAPFFTSKDALLAGGFVVGTIAMFPLDKRAATELLDSAAQANRLLKHAATGVELIASPGAYYIGGSLYLIGRVANKPRIADLGWHGTEAVLFGEGVTYFIKGVAGRARPFLSNGEDPNNFRAGKGFSSGDWSSFPSGHTTTAFAAAAAVTNETTRWWPHSTWYVGPLMYGGATAVGLSRMYHNRHWGSDVVLGAAIGTFSGRKVVQYAHGHPSNLLDRLILRTSVLPDGHGGARVAVSVEP